MTLRSTRRARRMQGNGASHKKGLVRERQRSGHRECSGTRRYERYNAL